MDSGIIDFKKQKFIRDCIEYLKTGDLPADLRNIINSSNPSYIEYLKKDNDDSTVKVIDTVINKVRQSSQKQITASRQKINIIALATLEKLATDDKRFEIPEVIEITYKRQDFNSSPSMSNAFNCNLIIFNRSPSR